MRSVTFTTKGALRKSALKQANERLILNAVRQNPAISRPDLARITGLSPSSLSFIVNRLKGAKLLEEGRSGSRASVGRRPTALRLCGDAKVAVAVEVAVTGSRVALVNLTGARLREKTVEWRPNHEIMTLRLHAAVNSVLAGEPSERVLGVGVGLPGALERNSGRVIAAENLDWFDVPFGHLLRGGLSLPFFFENNARASALAEQWFAAPGDPPLRDFVFVMPSEGLGAGISIGGQLLQGSNGMAGEFGHITVHPDGPACPCGNRGCLEQYASDKALPRYYREERGAAGQDGAPGASMIVRLARNGDGAARRALERMAGELALGLVNLVWVFNPQAVILGGIAAEAWPLIERTVWETLRRRAPDYLRCGLRVGPSRHTVDSVLLGAASLVFSQYFNSFEQDASRRVVMSAGL